MLTGGEGKEGEEQEEVEVYPLVGSDGVGGVRRGALCCEVGAAAMVLRGGSASAALSGGERAGKLHESDGKPFPVLVGVEEGRKGVLHGELRAAAPAMACGGAAALTEAGLGASGRGDATASGAG